MNKSDSTISHENNEFKNDIYQEMKCNCLYYSEFRNYRYDDKYKFVKYEGCDKKFKFVDTLGYWKCGSIGWPKEKYVCDECWKIPFEIFNKLKSEIENNVLANELEANELETNEFTNEEKDKIICSLVRNEEYDLLKKFMDRIK